MAKVLILGGQGFMGQNLTLRLVKENFEVAVFEKYITQERIIPNVKYFSGDFCNIQNYEEIFEDIDIVYHLISTTKPNSAIEKIEFDITSNLVSTIKMLNICVDKGVKKVIFPSSGGTIYGETEGKLITEDMPTNPICAYGINKLAIEKYLYMYKKIFGLDYTILRISNPYGQMHACKTQGAINVFIDRIKNNKTIEIWGDGSVKRDYIFIDDLIEAFYLAINDTEKKIFNVGSGEAVSLYEILEILKEVSQKDIKVKYTKARNIDVPVNCLDYSLINKHLNWSPKISLNEGIKTLYNL